MASRFEKFGATVLFFVWAFFATPAFSAENKCDCVKFRKLVELIFERTPAEMKNKISRSKGSLSAPALVNLKDEIRVIFSECGVMPMNLRLGISLAPSDVSDNGPKYEAVSTRRDLGYLYWPKCAFDKDETE